MSTKLTEEQIREELEVFFNSLDDCNDVSVMNTSKNKFRVQFFSIRENDKRAVYCEWLPAHNLIMQYNIKHECFMVGSTLHQFERQGENTNVYEIRLNSDFTFRAIVQAEVNYVFKSVTSTML